MLSIYKKYKIMSAPIEMRRYLAIMYGKEPVKSAKEPVEETTKKDMTMRDMLGKMRVMNEDIQKDLTTNTDKSNEENKMANYFEENNVTIDFENFKVFGNGVILTGTIDGQIQFAYKVTPEEQTSGIEVNYLEGFEPQDPENEEVINKVESYYDIFYKYWRDQLFKN